jgi:hypothetical protein
MSDGLLLVGIELLHLANSSYLQCSCNNGIQTLSKYCHSLKKVRKNNSETIYKCQCIYLSIYLYFNFYVTYTAVSTNVVKLNKYKINEKSCNMQFLVCTPTGASQLFHQQQRGTTRTPFNYCPGINPNPSLEPVAPGPRGCWMQLLYPSQGWWAGQES